MANTPTRYQPETGFTRLPDVIDQLFRESVLPPTRFGRYLNGEQFSNLLETNDAYIVQLALPGVDADKIQIEVVGRQLMVKGTQTIPTVEKANYLYHGLRDGEFSDMFELPMEVDGEKADATYDRGILSITLPKAEHAKPKLVKIHPVT